MNQSMPKRQAPAASCTAHSASAKVPRTSESESPTATTLIVAHSVIGYLFQVSSVKCTVASALRRHDLAKGILGQKSKRARDLASRTSGYPPSRTRTIRDKDRAQIVSPYHQKPSRQVPTTCAPWLLPRTTRVPSIPTAKAKKNPTTSSTTSSTSPQPNPPITTSTSSLRSAQPTLTTSSQLFL